MEDLITWQEILTQIINAVVGILIPVLATYAVLYARQGLEYVKLLVSERSPDLLATLEYVAREAVKYAEQAGFKKAGSERLEMAIARAQKDMAEAGFPDVDLQLIADKIHAALYDEINRYKEPIAG